MKQKQRSTYCFNCGEKVNEEFNHCPYCGTDLGGLKKNNIISETDKENGLANVEFSVAGRKLSFTQEFIKYNALRKRFFDKAAKLETEYIKYYTNKEHTFNSLFDEEISEVVYKTIEAVKFGVSVLMEYGIDDIDDEELSRMVSRDESIKDSLKYIFEKADEINRFAESLGDYREAGRANRSHWQGGGFGVGGAIKGAVTAGALNLGTNMFRGIGDAITNASDKAKIAKMKKELANDQKVFEDLHNTVFKYSIKVFYCVKDILVKNEIIDNFEFNYKKAEARANNYIKQYNVQKDEISYNKTIDVICECINDCPYSAYLYCELYSLFKGSKNEIHNLANYFGVERDYKKMIIRADSNWLKAVRDWEDDSVELLDKKIDELELMQSENPYLSISKYLDKLKKKKEKILTDEANRENDKIECEKIKAKYVIYSKALEDGMFDEVWNNVENGNLFAMYAIKVYYYNLSEPFNGKWFNVSDKIKPLTEKAKLGNEFAKYLEAFYEYFTIDNTAWLEKSSLDDQIKERRYIELKEFSQKENIMALGDVGYIKCTHFFNTKEEGVENLKKAAQELEPFALLHLGEGYFEGRWNLPKDSDLAERCFSYAAIYGLEPKKQDEETGGCFITSAVCKSLKKTDDCYELTAFRDFRDKWLVKQTDGSRLIKEYYEVAPKIVKSIDNTKGCDDIYQDIWDRYLYQCLNYIEKGEYKLCKNLYYKMVGDLKNKYLKKGELCYD